MNAFKKLALAAAVASVPMVGVAMEPLNDEGLSNVTGQDGISIGIDLNQLNLDVYIEDTDGFDGKTSAGVIGIKDLVIDTGSDGIEIEIDAGSSGAGDESGVIRLNVKADLVINDGSEFKIGVFGSDSDAGERVAATGWANINAAKDDFTEIMSMGNIELDGLELAIELGPEASNFLNITTTSEINITLDDFELIDASSTGSMRVEQIAINNIALNGTTGSITDDGLVLTIGNDMDDVKVALMGQAFGDSSAAALGNIYIDGLDLSNTEVTIRGH